MDRMKQDKVRIVVAIVLLFVAFGVLYWRYFRSPLGRFVVDVSYEGIILDPAKYPVDPPLTNVWKVTPADINSMESKLETYISRSRRTVGRKIATELRSYRRQYLGVLTDDGEKLIEAVFCHKDSVSRLDWLLYHFDMVGGMSSDWSIVHYVDTDNFSELIVNTKD